MTDRDARACGLLAAVALDFNHLIQRTTRAMARLGDADREMALESLSAIEERLIELRSVLHDARPDWAPIPHLQPITTAVRRVNLAAFGGGEAA